MVKPAFFLKRPLSDLLITNIEKVLIQFGQTHDICIPDMACVDCMMIHSAIKKIKGSRGENRTRVKEKLYLALDNNEKLPFSFTKIYFRILKLVW